MADLIECAGSKCRERFAPVVRPGCPPKLYCSDRCREREQKRRTEARRLSKLRDARLSVDIVCVDCGVVFNEIVARGRPRVRCYSCSPLRTGEKSYNCCANCGHSWVGSRPSTLCGACYASRASRKRADRRVASDLHKLRGIIAAAKRRQRKAAQSIYLECRCNVCGYPVWRDHTAVATRQRTCGNALCGHRLRSAKPEYRDKIAHKNNARRAAVVAGEPVMKSVVWERDGGVCHLCGELADEHDWHLDHVIPISRGGVHSYDNVAVSHPLCNLRKHNRLPGDRTPVC